MNAGLSWDDVAVGAAVTPLELPIAYDMVAGLIAGTRDWFPGHHDPAYAARQGKSDIYANTVFLHGLLDRIALRWAGPAWFVHRRSLKMIESVYPGHVLSCSGEVTAKGTSDAGLPTVSLDLRATQRGVPCITGTVTLALPARSRQWMESTMNKNAQGLSA